MEDAAALDSDAVSGDATTVARDRLGDPEAVYRVSPGRFFLKFALGMGLVVYGAVANALAWEFGWWRVDHVTILVLFAPPLTGLSLLRHLYATRGLRVLVYPAGLFRVQQSAAEAYPWDEVAAVGIKSDHGAAVVLTDDGRVTDCWLTVSSPVFRIGNAGVTIVRADGVSATLSPALAGYDELAERVQRATFRLLWPDAWDRFRAGEPLGFGPLTADAAGVWVGNRGVAWDDGPEVRVAGKNLIIAGRKKKVAADLDAVPNPHVLAGLVEAMRLLGVREEEEV